MVPCVQVTTSPSFGTDGPFPFAGNLLCGMLICKPYS